MPGLSLQVMTGLFMQLISHTLQNEPLYNYLHTCSIFIFIFKYAVFPPKLAHPCNPTTAPSLEHTQNNIHNPKQP